ncbi:MAG TPA: hypothetical protein VIY90_03780 [Steroidobacteraceae bacterium]
MIWRIFRKDWGQLWSLVAILAALQFANAAFWFALGPFEEPRGLVVAAQIFAYLVLLGVAVLVTVTVQQDALVGVSQDWLIRPVRRGALLCSKLLFVLITVHGPMLLADFAHGAAAGFSPRDTIAAALTRTADIALVVDLPVFAIAALTKTLVQAAATMLVIWFVVVVGLAVGILARGGAPPAFAASGMQWMTPAFWSALALCASIMIIRLQYRHRATARARAILWGAVLLAPLLSFSTWAAAFSVQRLLSTDPQIAQSIAVTFEPGLGRAATAPAPTSTGTVLLPIRVTGVAPNAIVISDRAFIRLVGRDGATLYRGPTTPNIGYGDDFPVITDDAGGARLHQRITIPDRIYQTLRVQVVQAQIDYSLTLFRAAAVNTIAAAKGDGRFRAFGWCRTAVDADGDDIELGCMKSGRAPTCVAVALENPVNGRRNPQTPYCEPDYAPLSLHIHPDAISHFGAEIKFQDLHQLAIYPVDGSQLTDARVRLQSYEPIAHFTRHLVIHDLRLGDWAADAQ